MAAGQRGTLGGGDLEANVTGTALNHVKGMLGWRCDFCALASVIGALFPLAHGLVYPLGAYKPPFLDAFGSKLGELESSPSNGLVQGWRT